MERDELFWDNFCKCGWRFNRWVIGSSRSDHEQEQEQDVPARRRSLVNRLGFGAMRLTGEGIWGWPPDRENAKKVLRRAVELGVNL